MTRSDDRASNRHGLPGNRLVTDSMILPVDYVEDAIDKPRRARSDLPDSVYGLRNGLLLGLVLWALILLPFFL